MTLTSYTFPGPSQSIAYTRGGGSVQDTSPRTDLHKGCAKIAVNVTAFPTTASSPAAATAPCTITTPHAELPSYATDHGYKTIQFLCRESNSLIKLF